MPNTIQQSVILTGTVKFFAGEPKNFGFITVSPKEDVFFHLNECCLYRCNGEDTPSMVGGYIPKAGDRVRFFKANRKGKTYASSVAPVESYEKALKEIQERPLHRLMYQAVIPRGKLSRPGMEKREVARDLNINRLLGQNRGAREPHYWIEVMGPDGWERTTILADRHPQ